MPKELTSCELSLGDAMKNRITVIYVATMVCDSHRMGRIQMEWMVRYREILVEYHRRRYSVGVFDKKL